MLNNIPFPPEFIIIDQFTRFLLYLIPGTAYLFYEVITEIAYMSSSNVYWDTLFSRMFKHRIGGYILSFVMWGFCYVLFSEDAFRDCYGISMFGLKKKIRTLLKVNL